MCWKEGRQYQKQGNQQENVRTDTGWLGKEQDEQTRGWSLCHTSATCTFGTVPSTESEDQFPPYETSLKQLNLGNDGQWTNIHKITSHWNQVPGIYHDFKFTKPAKHLLFAWIWFFTSQLKLHTKYVVHINMNHRRRHTSSATQRHSHRSSSKALNFHIITRQSVPILGKSWRRTCWTHERALRALHIHARSGT